MEELFEDWTQSLDMFGSLWLTVLGGPDLCEDWNFCLGLLENLCLDLVGNVDSLIEDPDVCINLLGSLYSDDPYFWTYTDL